MAVQTYDVLIIGSGASGGMAAHILTQKGASVLVLEAGVGMEPRHRALKPVHELPYRGFGKPGRLSHVLQANEFNANQWVDERQVPYTYAPDARYNWVRARLIGGKSNFWARMSYRLSDFEFGGKDHDGFGENWPIRLADLAPFYDRVEPIFRVSGRKEGVASLPDGQFLDDTSPDPGAAVKFAAAGKKHGMTLTKIRRSLGDGQLASSANLLLPKAQATGKLTLVTNAVVRELTIDKATGKVDGAHFVDTRSGRELYASAKAVVLGASCLESTRILLNSKIANSSGVLGRYLHDQFYIGDAVVASVPEARGGNAPRGLVGGSGYIPRFRNVTKGEKQKFLRGYAFDIYTGGTPDAKYIPAWGAELDEKLNGYRGSAFSTTVMGEVLPRYENQVTLDPKVVDAWGIPVLRFNAKYTDNEKLMAQDAIDTIVEACTEAGFEVLHRNPIPHPPGYSIHELGTCRMGDDPKTSVLNKWNQSHDVKNLFVVDGSSFVTGGSQNPTMTILSLSMRASEYLAEQMRTGAI